jgi:hypothetical protein
MRRVQLLSLLMLIALAAVVVTVLVTTARQGPNGTRQTADAEQPAEANAAPEEAAPEAEGSENPAAPAGKDSADSTSNGSGEQEPEAPQGPFIRRVELNGQDLADLLELSMWKFAFRIPENEYTLYLWVERWTRHAKEPEIRELTTLSGVWAENELVLKLPTVQDQRMFFKVGNSVSRSDDIPPIRPPSPWRRETIERETLTPGRDIHLITYTHNELETATGGRVDVHRQNDETIYVKMRFTPGPFVPFDPERITADSY